MTHAAANPRPLHGVRIIEFSGIGPGPFAGMLLADMGAQILSLERPQPSEFVPGPVLSRGKIRLGVDLRDPASKAQVLELLTHADALIEGFRPGVMERLGLGPDVVLAHNRRLVYGRMTGWGQSGPLATAAGHDINYIALSGALAAMGPPEQPLVPLNLLGDFGGGSLYLVSGLLAAMLSARITGVGQVVDAAIVDGAASLMALASELVAAGRWQERRGRNFLDGSAPFYRCYRCADGEFIAIGALEQRFYDELCRRIGLDSAASARRHDPAVWPELTERFAAIFASQTRAHWCALLEGTDACFAPVLTMHEAARHPHMAARQTWRKTAAGLEPAPAPRFSAAHAASEPPPEASLAEWAARWAATARQLS
ncbi:MAG: CoA transferase [Hyphomicrobiales bacterium]|nr:CoA transferase [Hyphomicrobiales bacterium]